MRHKKTPHTGASEPTPPGAPPEALDASLAPWAHLADDPSRWHALGADEQRRLGEALRDLFFAMSARGEGARGSPGRALVAAARPGPTAHVAGLDVSFYPGGRFCLLRFVDEQLIEPASLRPLFARPGAPLPPLRAVFVDPRELSFRTFENVIPLDRLFDQHPVELALTDRRGLGSRDDIFLFKVEATAATRQTLDRLDELGLYVPPLDTSYRGGERFIFHSSRLAEALTRAVAGAMQFSGPGTFSHVNPVFRCNRFSPGDARFHRHLDNPYFDRSRKQVSRYTLLLYLTGGRGEPALQLGSGADLASIDALTCVVFDQRIEHEGSPYLDGRKVFLRTELIFEVDELVDRPAIGQLFAKACYLTGESLFAPGLAGLVNEHYNRVAAAHWGHELGGDRPGEPFLKKSFRGVHFVANGHDFWFPRGALSPAECAALALLDFFNVRVDGAPFRSLCSAEVVRASEPGLDWVDRLLAPHASPPAAPVFAPLDPAKILAPSPPPDRDVCCSFHTSQFHLHEDVIERYREAQSFVRERLASAPVALMGQQLLLDPARFVVEQGRIQVLSSQALTPVHFAACQNNVIPPGILVGFGATLEVLQPLVPPILVAETGGCLHLMFDFFRNSWAIDPGQQTLAVPELIEGLDEPHLWGAEPWGAVERRLTDENFAKIIAGERWWLAPPVVVEFENRQVDVSDPSTDADTLDSLLYHDDRRASIAAAANPNLPTDTLARLLLAQVDRKESFSERRDENVAAWQNPATPVLLLLQPDPRHEEAALLVLLWLEHLHGVRLGPTSEDLADRVSRWALADAPPARAREHRIVRDFAFHLSDLFGLHPAPDDPEAPLDDG